jgi:hypothetical protein
MVPALSGVRPLSKWGLTPFLLLLALAAPAEAMWDGVRWNMSEAAVLAAGKGRLTRADGWGGRRVRPSRRPAVSLKDRLEGERELGGQRVVATFWFAPDDRLWSVTEAPLDADGPAGEACQRMAAALEARYGPADLATDKGELRHLIWRDERGRTRIHLRDSDGDCLIDYRELRGPLDR